MVLVDTSIWIDHLHCATPEIEALLDRNDVYAHPSMIGELLCGHIKHRAHYVRLFRALPMPELPTFEEVFAFIELHCLWGKGIGWTDANLVTTSIVNNVPRWTSDWCLAKLVEQRGGARVRPSS